MASGSKWPHRDPHHFRLIARVVHFDDLDEAGADVEADRRAFTSEEAHAPPSSEGRGKKIFPVNAECSLPSKVEPCQEENANRSHLNIW
jgi:hypothetical protein